MRAQSHKKAPACPRCKSSETGTLTNYGKPIPGRYRCFDCAKRRPKSASWFGPNNPPDAGGTGEEPKK